MAASRSSTSDSASEMEPSASTLATRSRIRWASAWAATCSG